MTKEKILEHNQYTVWASVETAGAYKRISFSTKQPDQHGKVHEKENAFELYMLPGELADFVALLQKQL